VFASVGPENATGNFTKMVQRLLVKITFAANQPGIRHLRIGMGDGAMRHGGRFCRSYAQFAGGSATAPKSGSCRRR